MSASFRTLETVKRRLGGHRVLAAVGSAALVLAATAVALVSLTSVEDELIASAQRGTLSVRLLETGTMKPVRSITYSSPLVGRQSEITFLVQEGTRVQAGDLIARLDTRELDVELVRSVQAVRQAEVDLRVAEAERDQAQADRDSVTGGSGAIDLFEAQTNLELAEKRTALMRADYAKLQPLIDRQFITREELDRLGLELQQAEADLEITRRRVELLQQQTRPRNVRQAELQLTQRDARLQYVRLQLVEARARVTALEEAIATASIHARQGGLVVYEDNLSVSPPRSVRAGDVVTSSQGLVTIPEVDHMLVESSVREADLHRIEPGQRVEVSVEAFPSARLQGRVASIGTLARPTAGRAGPEKRFDVIVELDPSDVELRPEMTAHLEILVGTEEDVLLIPVTAVFQHEGLPAVRLLQRRDVTIRLVDLGDTDDIMVEVVAGLDDGDQVSLRGDSVVPTAVESE